MKILFIIDSLLAGGKERRLTELIKNITHVENIFFEIVVLSKGVHYNEINELNIPVNFLLRKNRYDLSIFLKLFRITRSFKPDIIHCWDSMTAVFALPSCLVMGIKLVNGMIVDAPTNNHIFNKYYLRARFTFLFSHLIIGNSRAGLRSYRAPTRKSRVIYNGFNFDRLQTLEDNKILLEKINIATPFVIGMVASNSIFKDYDTFFRAAEIILQTRQDVTFLAIGSNTDDEDFMAAIPEKVLKNSRLLGKRNDIESLVKSMDVCVLSTFTEGISNAVMEYMALGKPVIATDGGGTNEIVTEGITGYLIPPKDAQAMAERIIALLDDKPLRLRLGEAGKERIRNEFSIDTMVHSFTDAYNSVLS